MVFWGCVGWALFPLNQTQISKSVGIPRGFGILNFRIPQIIPQNGVVLLPYDYSNQFRNLSSAKGKAQNAIQCLLCHLSFRYVFTFLVLFLRLRLLWEFFNIISKVARTFSKLPTFFLWVAAHSQHFTMPTSLWQSFELIPISQ